MGDFFNSFYLNETPIFGVLGHFFTLLAFSSTVFGCLMFLYKIIKKENQNIDKSIILSFKIHAFAIFSIFILIILLFVLNKYEYYYIWSHSNSQLPWYYIFSAIWEGQEGSFLIWMVWHSLLGLIFISKPTNIRVNVLSIILITEFFLSSMLLGIDFFGLEIGNSMFSLLRNELNIPIVKDPNYLKLIQDGNGLNILLQNYWMVIHPPVLFLGFASVTIPFGYVIYSLMSKDYTEWTKEILPWSIFATLTLGAGILMGGRWAYEALSFGGFWAWDPVENAVLVPWLFLLAALHTNIVYNSTKNSLTATLLLYILSFGFVLYSTFLTRSGILGDSSVHSFSDNGLFLQLVIFLGFMFLLPLLLLAYRWNNIPELKSEEKTSSREFWIFIGILMLTISAIQISYSTSIPVWNKLFNLKLAPPLNANEHYNSIQIWFSIIVLILMALVPFLKFKRTDLITIKLDYIKIIVSSLIVSILFSFIFDIPFLQYYKFIDKYNISFISSYFILLLSCCLVFLSTILYLIKNKEKFSLKKTGFVLSHFGFALLIFGALISQYKKTELSNNSSGIDFGKNFDEKEQSSNTLLLKNIPERMTNYMVTYLSDTTIKDKVIYKIKFSKLKDSTDFFYLYPDARYIREGEQTRLNAEPSIKHFMFKDIFTHISSVPENINDDSSEIIKSCSIHDSFTTNNSTVYFENVKINGLKTDLININATIKILNTTKTEIILNPIFLINTKNGKILNSFVESDDKQYKIKIEKIDPENKNFEFKFIEKKLRDKWIIVKVIEFPQINLLWLGSIIMGIGMIFLIIARNKLLNKNLIISK